MALLELLEEQVIRGHLELRETEEREDIVALQEILVHLVQEERKVHLAITDLLDYQELKEALVLEVHQD